MRHGRTACLNSLELPDAYHIKVESLRDLVEHADRKIEALGGVIHRRLVDDPGYQAIQAIYTERKSDLRARCR